MYNGKTVTTVIDFTAVEMKLLNEFQTKIPVV